MISISDEVLSTWLRYYYAANSVGYLVRHAKNDTFAEILSNRGTDELLSDLISSLKDKPESPEGVVTPYILAAALVLKGETPKETLMAMDARYTKWFHEYVESLFNVSRGSKLVLSLDEWTMSPIAPSAPRSLMSTTSFSIDGSSK